jgi:hypothetical protein
LVIVDALVTFRQGRRAKRNSDLVGDDYDVIAALRDLANRQKVAVLVVHHCSKAAREDILDTLSSTHGIPAAADGILILSRQRGKRDATLFITGRDLDEQELAVKFDEGKGLWEILGDAEQHRLSEGRDAILKALLDAREELWPRELAEMTGLKCGTVRSLLSRMHGDEQIRRVAGRYGLRADLVQRCNSATPPDAEEEYCDDSVSPPVDCNVQVQRSATALSGTKEPENAATVALLRRCTDTPNSQKPPDSGRECCDDTVAPQKTITATVQRPGEDAVPVASPYQEI